MVKLKDVCFCNECKLARNNILNRPHDASFILYHEVQSLLCVGTECGSVHVIGDEVHYIRPCLTLENNAVKAIVALFPNRILVHFNDDSIVLMELPSLDVVHLLEPSGWLSEKEKVLR